MASDSPSAARTTEELSITLEELRVAEEELRAQNEELLASREMLEEERLRYRELFDFAPDAYLVTNPGGRITDANRAAVTLFRVPLQFLIGKPLVTLVVDEARPAFREILAGLAQLVDKHVGEVLIQPRGTSPVIALVTVAPARDREGQVVTLRWLLRDITDHKQAERLAAIGQMAAAVAHESRNALQRSQACLERLRWKLEHEPEGLDLVNRTQAALDDLGHLFENVRTYAAPVRLNLDLCDLASVWREAWARTVAVYEGRDLQLREETAALDLRGTWDAFRLQQVFRNMFDNAVAACSDPCRIDVRCAETVFVDTRALRIAVHDNGPGLNAEQARKIFEPFYTTKPKGTGLGMALARRIVEAHGGQIAVGQSDRPGAEIVLTLPWRSQ
jgi:PAS domain S-box-containing protein